MEGQGRLIGGLALVLVGILGVGLTTGLPMWRESSFVGANIVSAQTIWDGLWLACVVQSTGQMQCKKPSGITYTTDLQAGRALTLLSIILGLIGFIIAIMGGGVANCSSAPPDDYYTTSQSGTRSSQNKAALLGGLLCLVAGVLCLVAVIWSAALTAYVSNDPLIVTSLKRDVGTSIYIGLASGVLLLLGGAVVCMVCGNKPSAPQRVYLRPPVEYSYAAPSQDSRSWRKNGPYDQPLETRDGSRYPAWSPGPSAASFPR
ncbi:claudin-4-like [Gadus chalcogrammus]|uniref:claudin-4-like n=1 Tax=Gadus chalcogrammus TaxID=1042646 RepID=UPI0024C49687|nr:claudin-4-like [Gadus chalcogrammus]